MDYLTPISIVALGGLINASFQLGVSMMTLLSGHALGSKRSGHRALVLASAFFAGAATMTLLIISFLTYLVSKLWTANIPLFMWALAASLALGLGGIVWATYYRPGRDNGTALWLPRAMAAFLTHRTKATRDSAEAFSLGLVGVLAELIFMLPSALAAALAIAILPTPLALGGLFGYTLLASLGLAIVVVLIGSGRHISHIQRWREHNKRFLQFAAGGGLIVLGFFIYVMYVATATLPTGDM